MSTGTPQIQDDPSIIQGVYDDLRRTFLNHKTQPLAFRKKQLQRLLQGLTEMEQDFHSALQKDLGVTQFNSYLYSYKLTIGEVEDSIANLYKWAKPRSLDTTIFSGPAKTYIQPEPYGVALVMSAWNYPLYTAIPAMAQAMAAGNCVVVKPSEMAPHTSNQIKKLIEKYVDQDCYRCIEGQVQVSIKITTLPWGLIIFTGSPEKGRLVAKAAAENLVPCILELGGKSPTIIDADANIENAALRVAQGRFTNSGQTCIACDYLFVHTSIREQFQKKLLEKVKEFYGKDPQKSEDYSRIISEAATQRLVDMMDPTNHKGEIILGGKGDLKDKYIAPTIINNPSLDSKIMKEEIFGPILPILGFTDIKEVVKYINNNPNPLALYYFGSQNKDFVKMTTSSGAYVVNEAITQLSNPNLPFGGVGNSGSGKYHGQQGFDSCSHLKPVFDKAPLNCFPFSARYPPYTQNKQAVLRALFATTQHSQAAAVKVLLSISMLILLGKVHQNRNLIESTKNFASYVQQKLSRL